MPRLARFQRTVAALLSCSDATARRRIEQLLARGVLRIRAVVEPAVVGLPVETLVWIRVTRRGAAMRDVDSKTVSIVYWRRVERGGGPRVKRILNPGGSWWLRDVIWRRPTLR